MGWLKGKVTADTNGNVFKAKGEYVNRDRVGDPNCIGCEGTFVQIVKGRTVACRHC